MKVKILGVGIDNLSFYEAVDKVLAFLKDGRKHYVITPNPEIIMLSQKDKRLKDILNKADLAIADGVGLVLASAILKGPKAPKGTKETKGRKITDFPLGPLFRFLHLSPQIKERVTGTDLADKLCELAAKKGFTVGFLGGRTGVAEKAAECQKARYPGLKIALAFAGDPNARADLEVRKKIKKTDILLVAYGAPRQEYWIARNLSEIPVKVALGVGGALDYFAGAQIRAPKFIRDLGLEWFWRLLHEPSRIKRQIKLLTFILLVFREAIFSSPFTVDGSQ